MTASTTDLIAEARRVADAIRQRFALGAADAYRIDALADALEAATKGRTIEVLDSWQAGLNAGAALPPRVVSTVAELDALPKGTVLRDNNGDVFEVVGTDECGVTMTGERGIFIARNWMVLPATVLWVGGTE